MKAEHSFSGRVLSVGRALFFWISIAAGGGLLATAKAEETFATLTIGGDTYTNVTVISKTRTHVTFMHPRGMLSVKHKDLDAALLKELGYVVEEPKKTSAIAIPQQLQNDPRLKELEAQARQQYELLARQITPEMVWGIIGGIALVYLFFCYACHSLVRRTNNQPGVLVWIPGLQMIPLFRAAGMSGWFFLLMFVPVVSLFVTIYWCVRICRVRQKSGWLALLLLLPVTNVLTFLYLAFADGESRSTPKTPKFQFSYQN